MTSVAQKNVTSYSLNSGSTEQRLDLFSTSRTRNEVTASCAALKCVYGAPYFAWKSEGKNYHLTQGNCHHWDCPKCGISRAKAEYGRMVEGAKTLTENGHVLYFLTLTCRGKEMTREQAENGYLAWTDKFWQAARAKYRRAGKELYYAGVTERQRRGHPHSHYLTTFDPGDLLDGFKIDWKKINGLLVSKQIPALRSEWIASQCQRAGLGDQYDISKVRNHAAASRYVAKYLFKPSALNTVWPKGWKRVRYTDNWPKLPEQKTDAFVLLADSDWMVLAARAVVVTPHDSQSEEMARLMLPRFSQVLIRPVKAENALKAPF